MRDNNQVLPWKCEGVGIKFKPGYTDIAGDPIEEVHYKNGEDGCTGCEVCPGDLLRVFFESGSTINYHWDDVWSFRVDGDVIEEVEDKVTHLTAVPDGPDGELDG